MSDTMRNEAQHGDALGGPISNEGLITAALWRAARAANNQAALADWLPVVEQAVRDITGARLVLVTAGDGQAIHTAATDLSPRQAHLLRDSLLPVLQAREEVSRVGESPTWGDLYVLDNPASLQQPEKIVLRELEAHPRVHPDAALIAPLRGAAATLDGFLLAQGIADDRLLGPKQVQAFQVLAHQVASAVEGRRLTLRADELRTRMQAIRTAVAHLAAPRELETILEFVVETAERVFGADGASIFLRTRDGILGRVSRGVSDSFLKDVRHVGSEPLRSMLQQADGPLYIGDLWSDALPEPQRELARREGIRSLVLVPLAWEKTIFGGFAIYHRRQRPYSQEEMDLAETLAEHAAIAVHRARLASEAQHTRCNLEGVINSMSDGLLVYDTRGTIILTNGRLYDLFGLDASTRLEDVHIRDFVRLALTKGATDSATKVYLEPERDPLARPRDVVELKHPETRFLEVINQPVVSQHQDLIGRAIFHRDITRERDSQRVKDEFLSMLSHELRTPLTSIKGYAQILLRRAVSRPDGDARALQAIDVQTDRMLKLIEDLLTVSRAEKGQIPLQLESTDPVLVAREVVDELSGISPRHAVTLEIKGQIPCITADPRRLRDVLLNLVENAIKYSPEGGRVMTEVTAGDGEVSFSVTDFGIGIPENQWARVFDEFYQMDSSSSRRFGGVGLGLHICKLIVEAHGGHIEVHGAPGEGSVFSFTLPACACSRRA